MVETLLSLMLLWKVPEETDASKLARWRPLVEQVYEQCKRYEEETHVRAETCAVVAVNGVYWETGLQARLQTVPKAGPSGEECFFQLHRTAEQIPFERWRPVHPYGTRHGKDLRPCVEDGVRVFAYHMWRCHLDEEDLRGPDGRNKLWHLYSEYHRPTAECWRLSGLAPIRNRANMARRLLQKIPASTAR